MIRWERVALRLVVPARRLVYWLGFRPRPGTILYSPSREMQLVLGELYETFVEGLNEGMRLVRDALQK